MPETFETTWEQLPTLLVQQLERLGRHRSNRRVRMSILHSAGEEIVTLKDLAPSGPNAPRASDWIKRLRALAESQPRLPHEVDDSRDAIYAETMRDSG